MVKAGFVAAPLLVLVLLTAPVAGDELKPETIIALERSALDRWGKGDPQGFLETYAKDVSYFAPAQEHRVDGLAAMHDLLTPITGKIKIASYEMINPKVQHRGDVAVLSYQLVSHATQPTENRSQFAGILQRFTSGLKAAGRSSIAIGHTPSRT